MHGMRIEDLGSLYLAKCHQFGHCFQGFVLVNYVFDLKIDIKYDSNICTVSMHSLYISASPQQCGLLIPYNLVETI